MPSHDRMISRNRFSRRGALRLLLGASLAAASGVRVEAKDAAALDPMAFLQGFLQAQQDRDLERLRSSFASGHRAIWVHNGRRHRGERAYFAWLSTHWSGPDWRVTPLLAEAEAIMVGESAVCAACPVDYHYRRGADPIREVVSVSAIISDTPLGPRLSALFTTDVAEAGALGSP